MLQEKLNEVRIEIEMLNREDDIYVTGFGENRLGLCVESVKGNEWDLSVHGEELEVVHKRNGKYMGTLQFDDVKGLLKFAMKLYNM